jgi:WD40 repeat protein
MGPEGPVVIDFGIARILDGTAVIAAVGFGVRSIVFAPPGPALTGPSGITLTGHSGPVTSVAVTQLDGRPVAVSASDDDTVRVWDLTTRKQIGRPLTGHTGSVNSVAVGQLDGRLVAVSGGYDAAVRVWDLAAHEEAR